MPKVTVIPPSINRTTRQSTTTPTRRKVAAYARVSTDFEEQLTSYEAQILTIPITFKEIRIGNLLKYIQMKE